MFGKFQIGIFASRWQELAGVGKSWDLVQCSKLDDRLVNSSRGSRVRQVLHANNRNPLMLPAPAQFGT